MGKSDTFSKERAELNDLIQQHAGRDVKRFFKLDNDVYKDGVISAKYKEMMGLVGSILLRCDDCISYHVIEAHEKGMSAEEFDEILGISLVIGGSITIPHIRRAVALFDELS